VLAALQEKGLRATMDDGNDRVQAKIKVAADLKIPYLLVVGPRDEEAGSVSLRARGIQKDLGALPLADAVEGLAAERDSRGGTSLGSRFA
jgi:threonyl-tRNA synthetase